MIADSAPSTLEAQIVQAGFPQWDRRQGRSPSPMVGYLSGNCRQLGRVPGPTLVAEQPREVRLTWLRIAGLAVLKGHHQGTHRALPLIVGQVNPGDQTVGVLDPGRGGIQAFGQLLQFVIRWWDRARRHLGGGFRRRCVQARPLRR